MYLKSFEIQGFKSFPDKIALAFGLGVSAVVGPNGSGKSNIAEAARWVLGEQSPRALRCEKRMEELIFHGAAHRGPMGFAEVSLLLDNSGGLFPMEQNEVMVTRRLYRSGESEYFINRAAVRLKDVLELFMDTGLGRDGYCLIGQGRIGEILSEKSGDRRRVFEEASGIARFRHRKEESERKLASAEENLTRIGDKIEELELQVGPLRAQAETAKEYLRLRDELRGLEISLWLDSLQKLRLNYDKVRENYRVVSGQLEAGQTQVASLYAETERLQEEERDSAGKAEEARGALSALEARTAELDSAAAVLRATLSHNEENMERLQAERTAGQDRDGGLQAQIEAKEIHREELTAGLAALEAGIAALLSRIEELSRRSGGGAARLDALRVQEAGLRETMSSLREQLSSQTAAAAEWEARRQAAETDASVRETGIADAERQMAELDQKRAESAERLSALQNVISGYQMRRESRQKKVDAIKEKQSKLTAGGGALQSRIHMLREMEKEYEGHSRAVKVVMRESERGGLRGLHGALSALLRADDRCAYAVEIALGAALQNIVSDREEDAKAAIEYLRRQDAGRATFLPLSAIRGRNLDESGLDAEPGFVGLASELVTFAPRYGEIVRNLLGRTVVVETMDAAIGLARRRGRRFRIVTLDGQVVAPGGAMTGGSAGKNVGVLSRKNELDRLEVQLSENAAALDALSRELVQAERELSAVSYDCEVALAERRVAEDEALSLRSERAHKGVWMDGLREALVARKTEIEELTARIAEGETNQQALRGGIEEHTTRADQLAAESAALSEGQSGLQTESASITESIAEMRAKRAAMGAEKASEENAIDELSFLREQLMGDLERRERVYTEFEDKNRELLAAIHVKQGERSLLGMSMEEARGLLESLYAGRQELEGRRVLADRAAREKNEENLRLERERSRLEAQKASGEAEEKAIMDKLWDTYGLTHSAALEQRIPLDSVPKAGRRVNELKSAITALGPPNIGAIEEYSRVSERYEYLAAQRDDAAGAKADLLGIIEDLTGQMREIFLTQFKLIGEKFGQTFKEIFGGGDAFLELEDPEDPLNCGVEIKAQPPGKKMRSISLLSGGEKSLVAIALYFAIFKVRPAPFCILDEVDHDLDDVNVARFAAYLRRLAEDIQFVVITHRRGTMEMADMLYGVTTQEEGVSKILALKLQDADKTLGMTLE